MGFRMASSQRALVPKSPGFHAGVRPGTLEDTLTVILAGEFATGLSSARTPFEPLSSSIFPMLKRIDSIGFRPGRDANSLHQARHASAARGSSAGSA